MKLRFVILLVVFLLPHTVFASVCSKDGYTVLTINGMYTEEGGAKKNAFFLDQKLDDTFNNQPLTVDFLHNESHMAGVGDSVDVIVEKILEGMAISTYDLVEIINDASQKVKTQKILLVAHSEGNFYANTFYKEVTGINKVPGQSIGIYGVATPASYVAGFGSKYITSSTDQVINKIRWGRALDVLPSNADIKLPDGDNSNGHSFSDVYLKYEGERIINEIKWSLSRLVSTSLQDENKPCIIPPEFSLFRKIQGGALVFLDHPVNTTRDIGLAIGNGVLNGINTLASAISSLAQSLFNNTQTLAANNPASVINAMEPAEQNPKPAEAKPAEARLPQNGAEALPPPLPPAGNTNTEEIPPSVAPVPVAVFQGGGGGSRVVTGTSSAPAPPPDTTAPVISITGVNPLDITQGAIYTDAGATALDEKDGTVNVITTGTVDTAVVGAYIITYTATDLANNIATATRTVNVVAPPPPDTTAPNIPIVNALSQFTNTNNVVITGTAEVNSTVTITGGTSTTTGVATGGNFSISVSLNQNILNTFNITATDAANNASNPATVSTTHDNLPPVISSVAFVEPPTNVMLVERSFNLNINADAFDYTAGVITINEVPVTNFRDNRNNIYTVTHTVAFGETDRTSGTVPISVVLTDPAGNSNVAYTTVVGNGVVIKGHYPASVAQVFPTFGSDGKFTQDVVLSCVTNSGYLEMYYVRDSDSTFRMMNILNDVPYTLRCPSDSKTVISSGMGFADFSGYSPIAGWYYGVVSIGDPKCDASKNDTVCVNDNVQSFFRLYRSAGGVWSDTGI